MCLKQGFCADGSTSRSGGRLSKVGGEERISSNINQGRSRPATPTTCRGGADQQQKKTGEEYTSSNNQGRRRGATTTTMGGGEEHTSTKNQGMLHYNTPKQI